MGSLAIDNPRHPAEEAFSDLPFPLALDELLAARRLTLRELAGRAGVPLHLLRRALDASEPDPPRKLLEAIAAPLAVSPSWFREDRLRAVLEHLQGQPQVVDRLFFESLTEIERRSVEPAAWSRVPLKQALRPLLEAEQLTQGDLADDLGTSGAELSHALHGRRRLLPEFLEQVATILGVPPEHFLEYRLAVLRDWLLDRPERLNLQFGGLDAELTLAPFRPWAGRPLPSPLAVSRPELIASLVEIAGAEGPIVGARLYALRVASAAIMSLTPELRRCLNSAAHEAVRSDLLLAHDELGTAYQRDLTLRTPGTEPVVPRRRGPRELRHIPPGELIAFIRSSTPWRRGAPIHQVQDAVIRAFELRPLTLAGLDHLNHCINRARERE
jgi:transcriptional regulator with XRE-family HTH domain